jgi:uncharacterized protein (TIGR03435 family)
MTQLAVFTCAGAPPAFEVATVKRVQIDEQSRQPIGLFCYPGGRIKATNYTLRMLIHDAFGVEDYQVAGGPPWASTDRYAIDAKPPATSPSSQWVPESFKSPPTPELRLMLQSLLADRFQLKVHRESRPATIYALARGKRRPKLDPPKDTTLQPFVSFGRTGAITEDARSLTLTGQNATIDQLCARMAQVLRRPVMNKTRIAGHFDFFIEYAGDESQSEEAPALTRAIRERLGLKLERQPGSISVLVIEGAQRPSPN